MKQNTCLENTYTFNNIINEIQNSGLSSVCRTINKFNKLMDNENASSKNKDLEKLIKEDINFSLAILKSANSSIYKPIHKQDITDISLAINMIGWEFIYKIGMSLTVKGLIKTIKGRTFANWMICRAITIANISEIFLKQIKLTNNTLKNINSVYAYGLTHDIGSLALLQTIERYQQDVMEIKLKDKKINWSEAEYSLYGFDHNMLGEQILMESLLPRSFALVAKYHHSPNPLKYSESESKMITLIRLAQSTLVDIHKFSEHSAFSDFNSISDENILIRDYNDFSEALQNEFKQELGLTEELYNEIKEKQLTDNFIEHVSDDF